MASCHTTKNAIVTVRIRNDRVTGSSLEFTVTANDVRGNYVVDKGLFMDDDPNAKNFLPEDQSHVDAVFLTHAHIDHSGQIPHMCKNGFTGPIYMSKETSQISQCLISDEFFVLEQNGIPMTKEDERAFRRMINQTRTVKLYDNINLNGAIFTLLDNAHVLGSNMVYMATKGAYRNMKILVTGDYRPEHPFLRTFGIKKFLKRKGVDVLFIESTYGGKPEHQPFGEALEEFKDAILEIINGGGDVLVPVFSFDRTQVILYALKELQKSYSEMRGIPIYLDGKLAQKITSIYLQDSVMANGSNPQTILPCNLEYVVGKQARDAVHERQGKIILATSGQMHSGAIVPHMLAMLENPKNGIVSVGYVGHKVGKSILEANPGDVISYSGRDITVRARRYVINGFSAHADMLQLAEFVETVKKYNPKLKVVLYHGDEEAKEAFRMFLLDFGVLSKEDILIPKSDECITISKYTLSSGQMIKKIET